MEKIEHSIKLPYELEEMDRLSDLIYYEGPLLSHFVNKSDDHYLFYWVENDDKYNRWLVARETEFDIREYVEKRKTLYDVLTNPCDRFVLFVDIDEDVNYTNTQMVFIEDIPPHYLPRRKSFYRFSPCNEMTTSSISKKLHSGVMELHLNGEGVEYGSMSANKLASTIVKFDDIRESILTNIIKKDKYSHKGNKTSFSIDDIISTRWNISGLKAGSMRVIMTPNTKQLACADTINDVLAESLVDLIGIGEKDNDIKNYSAKYGQSAIKKYGSLVENIYSNRISIDFKWSNDITGKNISSSLNQDNIDCIRKNLNKIIENNHEDIIDIVGTFFTINVDSKKFGLRDTDNNRKMNGYFDASVINEMLTCSFDSPYRLKIKRTYSTKNGLQEKVSNTIIEIRNNDN